MKCMLIVRTALNEYGRGIHASIKQINMHFIRKNNVFCFLEKKEKIYKVGVNLKVAEFYTTF